MAGSVTHWLLELQAGNRDAVRPIWERYYSRLVSLAKARLSGIPRRAADEEDVVLVAFDSFCRGVEQGKFPDLHDRDCLWSVLVLITARKAANQATFEARQKRSHRRTDVGAELAVLEVIASNEPTPEFSVQAAEEYRHLLLGLGDEKLQSIAVWRMEGYTNEEIAGMLTCSVRTIERKLELIRAQWMLRLCD
jgi:DNA-directed RNA polymerase specialized sigma24 family protein